MKKLIGIKSRFLIATGFLFAVLSISNSCSKPQDNMANTGSAAGSGTVTKGGSEGPGTNEVWIQGMAYNPSTITVTAGTTITWTNKDGVAHTVTSSTGLFDSGSIGTNGTYSRTFTTTGTFEYYCIIHPSMVASVVVN
jgi:plastocyanin